MVHISKTSIDIFRTLLLLDILAERAASFLHVCKLVLVLKEELTALIAHSYGHIRHHCLEESTRPLGAELRVVDNKDLLITHAFKDSFIYLHRLVLFRRHLIFEPLEHSLGKEVVLQIIILLLELQSLLLYSSLLLPSVHPPTSYYHL